MANDWPKKPHEADPLNLGNAVLCGFGLHLQGKSKVAADLSAARDDLHRLAMMERPIMRSFFPVVGEMTRRGNSLKS